MLLKFISIGLVLFSLLLRANTTDKKWCNFRVFHLVAINGYNCTTFLKKYENQIHNYEFLRDGEGFKFLTALKPKEIEFLYLGLNEHKNERQIFQYEHQYYFVKSISKKEEYKFYSVEESKFKEVLDVKYDFLIKARSSFVNPKSSNKKLNATYKNNELVITKEKIRFNIKTEVNYKYVEIKDLDIVKSLYNNFAGCN